MQNPEIRDQVLLEIFRAKVDGIKDKADETLLKSYELTPSSHLLAWLTIAHHNTKLDKDFTKEIESWEDPRRIFAFMGAAQALQEK